MAANPVDPPNSFLRLETRSGSDGPTVRCLGRLTSDSAAFLKSAVKPLMPGAKCVTLDLSGLTFMDSAGLGAVVSLYVSAKSAHCGLRLINLNQHVKKLLGLTKVLSLFEACGEYLIKMP